MLTFNLAYELALKQPMLVADVCPQCNLTETLMREHGKLVGHAANNL